MKDLRTPAWIDAVVDNLAPVHLVEEIRGDLYELFSRDVQVHGTRTARQRYVLNAFGFLIKSFFWQRSHPSNHTIMLSNYFIMAKRSLLSNKGTSAINIIGLVTGFAAALVLFTVIRYELSYDRFHSNAEQIYRLVRVMDGVTPQYRSGISFPVHRALREEMSSVENILAMEYFGGANVDILDSEGKTLRKFREESGFGIVEPSFFNVFDFGGQVRWLSGNPAKAFNEPFNLVLTKSMAKKYFGDEEPLGQTIKLQRKFDCKITGVIEDFPPNTDFPFTVILSYASVATLAGDYHYESWYSVNDSHHVFVVLPKGVAKEAVEKNIAKVHAAHTPKELHESRQYLLQELRDVHRDSKFGNYNRRTISEQTIYGLGIIAVFLILTGSINYINLATAQSVLRSKEIGVRKVMGGNQRHIMMQFLTETLVIVSVSAVLGVLVAELMLIKLSPLLNLKLERLNFTDPVTLSVLLVIVLAVTLLAGFYPSIIVSKFNPITALKNRLSANSGGGASLRKVLVIVQFTITQVLVVGTYIVMSQMQYFNNVDMGFNKEGIITARVPVRNLSTLGVLEEKLRAQPLFLISALVSLLRPA
jgi:putative ABC transport system permease protein